MSAVNDAIKEIEAALKADEPRLEGFEDFNRLNIHDDTREDVQEAINIYQHRVSTEKAVLALLHELLQGGYPAPPVISVTTDELADLADQVATIAAAFKQFDQEQAASLGLTPGKVELK